MSLAQSEIGVTARRRLPAVHERLLVGDGLAVSPFCLGMVGDPRVVSAAFDLGINFFFVTTDMHWPLYEALRRGLADLLARGGSIRDRIVVAGVCYPTQPEFCASPFHELLDALPLLGRIDLLVAGGAYATDIVNRALVLRRVAQSLGARGVGASFHDRGAALMSTNHGLVDLCYLRYNPVHAGARDDVFPHLRAQRSTPIFNFKSTVGYLAPDRFTALGLAPGFWHPAPTDYYRYALSRAAVDGVLFSAGAEAHLYELAAALQAGGLLPEEEAHLESLAALSTRQAMMR
jgi:hypothetical protein